MTEETITFDKEKFSFQKEEDNWILKLKRSDIASQSIEEVRFLEIDHPLLLPQVSEWDKESVIFTYAIEGGNLSYESLKKKQLSEKLRIALNAVDFEACLELPITFFLHPANIFINRNGVAKLAYRALPGLMKPTSLSKEDFLRQLKCFILTLFTENDFTALYSGSMEVIDIPDFLKEILTAKTVAEIRESLTASYEETSNDEGKRLSLISHRRYKVFKHLTIWLSVLSLALAFPLLYLIFLQMPFQQKDEVEQGKG